MKNIFTKLKNPKVFQPLAIIIVVFLVVVSYLFYQLRLGRVFVDDSLIQAPIVNITATGTLTELDVYEGQQVKKGDKLAVVSGQTIYAQADGLITVANNLIGSNVSGATPLMQMVNPQDMRVAGTIDENKGLSDIHVGQVVSFTVDALAGKTFWGYVDEISPSAKQTQVSFSISSERPTQQFIIYAKYNSTKYPEIKNGMSAKLTVYTDTK